MLARRPAVAATGPAVAHRTPRPETAVTPRPPRMSFSERRALETLPASIAALQARVQVLNAELADTSLYARDPDRFAAKSTELAAAHDQLTAAQDQWLILEMRREEIEGL
jgi:ATP-binding cassette subfamily F protein uup